MSRFHAPRVSRCAASEAATPPPPPPAKKPATASQRPCVTCPAARAALQKRGAARAEAAASARGECGRGNGRSGEGMLPTGDKTCPVSTEGGTRRIQLVREGGGGVRARLHADLREGLAQQAAVRGDPLRGRRGKLLYTRRGRRSRRLARASRSPPRPVRVPLPPRGASRERRARAAAWHPRESVRRRGGAACAGAACPVSTEGRTRRVQLVREEARDVSS